MPRQALAGVGFVLLLVGLYAGFGWAPDTAAHHNGHLLNSYYVAQFVGNISAGGGTAVPIYDCAGEGHDHDGFINAAVAQWNDTLRVKFSHSGAETPCILSGGDAGFPTADDRTSIHLMPDESVIRTADFTGKVEIGGSGENDLGPEGDSAMRPFVKGRIRISPNSHSPSVIQHELGHAAGLHDLYVDGTPRPPAPTPLPTCANGHSHNPLSVTIMSCGIEWLPGSHDIANLDLLYKNPPTQVSGFDVVDMEVQAGGTVDVSFEWTDRTYNEVVQYIGFPGAPLPLPAAPDEEDAVWTGLALDTQYCFSIVQQNGYGIFGASSQDCVRTPPEPGIYDMLVHWPGQPYSAFFHCIVRLNYGTQANDVVSRQQCYNDIPPSALPPRPDLPPGWSKTCDDLGPPVCLSRQLTAPGEPDSAPGPLPGPPHLLQEPSSTIPEPGGTSTSEYFHTGGPGCGASPCFVLEWCFEDVGPPNGIGPNMIWRVVVTNPASPSTLAFDFDNNPATPNDIVANVATGTVSVWYNQWDFGCAQGTTAGTADLPGLPLIWVSAIEGDGQDANPQPVPWRQDVCGSVPCNPNPNRSLPDFDGDGCWDWDELRSPPVAGCGDDPYNRFDSFDANTVDLNGYYDIVMQIASGDCTSSACTSGVPGEYMSCKAAVQHDTGTNAVAMPIYCYHDSVSAQINPEGYPGVDGDGFWGAPPPGNCSDSTCANGNYAFGDVGATHAVLTGTFSPATALVDVTGCIADTVSGGTNHTYLDLTVSGHQLVGDADIWTSQTQANCQNGTPVGAPAHDDVDTFWARQPDARDSDVDGVPDARELTRDANCGQRDPFNPYDNYDVSIPRDGVIDLSNDILGVILHFNPGGYPLGDENWDRPNQIAGSAGHWNRGSPDGVIDLSNDILGVILQFNPGGC